jgi:hypothetical protein
LRLFLFLLICISNPLFAIHPVNNDSDYYRLVLKYWQYRETFYRHFILIDRDASGCIHDGIGSSTEDPCSFSKESYSLPATSISVAWSGDLAFGERNNPQSPFYDPECMKNVHWDQSKGKRFNIINLSSETPSQLGWYIQVLATEYENLRRYGQKEQMRRSLEELFLALQAIRRLDMQAQCIFNELYQQKKNCKDCSVCDKTFRVKGEHSKLTKVKPNQNCAFQMRLDGYYGFIIREDGTQGLGEALHDPSEEKWNIDATSSYHAMIKSPCTKQLQDRACFLYAHQGFQSQDQVIGLLNGLVFVKKFIPKDATIKTCEGKEYHVLDIATKIVDALVNRIDENPKDFIEFPFSKACIKNKNWLGVKKRTNLNNFEGGQSSTTIYGMKMIQSYFHDKKINSNFREKFYYKQLLKQTLKTDNNVGNFWLLLEAISNPKSNPSFSKNCIEYDKQIYLLMNETLFGKNNNNSLPKTWYTKLLNNAPCNGLCMKNSEYGSDRSKQWPLFDCANAPGWVNGERWDGGKKQHEVYDEKEYFPKSKINNGLDYMSLFNLYSLYYSNHGFPIDELKYIKDNTIDKSKTISNTEISNLSIQQAYAYYSYDMNTDKVELINNADNFTEANLTNKLLLKEYFQPRQTNKYTTSYQPTKNNKKSKPILINNGSYSDQCLEFEWYRVNKEK